MDCFIRHLVNGCQTTTEWAALLALFLLDKVLNGITKRQGHNRGHSPSWMDLTPTQHSPRPFPDQLIGNLLPANMGAHYANKSFADLYCFILTFLDPIPVKVGSLIRLSRTSSYKHQNKQSLPCIFAQNYVYQTILLRPSFYGV
jgi:hypothetical protein